MIIFTRIFTHWIPRHWIVFYSHCVTCVGYHKLWSILYDSHGKNAYFHVGCLYERTGLVKSCHGKLGFGQVKIKEFVCDSFLYKSCFLLHKTT